jgi:adenosylcobinamide kinase/adenosylcobinamide-phosphate guanylyltransferase
VAPVLAKAFMQSSLLKTAVCPLLILQLRKCMTTILSNEVGMGIVPLGEINRQFQDEQGRLNQAVAAVADVVLFIAAGLPIKLKG